MSRIFLLSANATTEPYAVYPLGMAVIAGALAAAGHDVRQFDWLAADCDNAALENAVRDFDPEAICLSLRNIDNVDSFCIETHWYLAQARERLETVRRASNAPVIVGGAGFSIMPEEILDYLGAEHGVVGEGDRAVCTLIEGLATGKVMPRLIRSEGRGLDATQMARPLFQQDLVDYYVEQSGMVNLQTKRGCPWSCSYCTYPALEGIHFRPREPKDVVDDLERLLKNHNTNKVFFTDSVFNDAAGHYLEVTEELIRRELDIAWCGFFRPQGIGRKEIALLKRSGLYAMELGTDAASDVTLAGMDKRLTFDDVFAVNQACIDERLPAAHFVIFGGPGETEETLEEGLANMDQLGPQVVFGFSGIRLLPRTPLHKQAIEEGVIAADAPLMQPVYYYSPHIDPEKMNARIEAHFLDHRNRVFPPSEGQARLSVMQRFGFKGIMWDQLVKFPKA